MNLEIESKDALSAKETLPLARWMDKLPPLSTWWVKLPPFPTCGVKLSIFLKFIEDNGGRDAFLKKPIVKEPLTTTDVCNKF